MFIFDDLDGTRASKEPETLTIDTLMEIIKKIPPCPFAECMKEQGCDPKDGWVLVVPKYMLKPEDFCHLPGYVKTSPFLDKPVMMNPKEVSDDLRGID